MEIRKDEYVQDAPHKLYCTCGSQLFSIQFRKSKSVQMYEEMGGTGHKPDTMVVVCGVCEQEITIVETEAKMPPTQVKEEVYQAYLDDQIRRNAGVPMTRTYTTYGPAPGTSVRDKAYSEGNRKIRVRFDPSTDTHYVDFEEE